MHFEQFILVPLALFFGMAALACFHHGMSMHQHAKPAPAFLRFINLAAYFNRYQTDLSRYHLRRHLQWGVACIITAVAVVLAMYILLPEFRAEVVGVIGTGST